MKRVRVFKDPAILREMLELRRQGNTYEELAFRYGVDKSSIAHWCEQYQLGGKVIEIIRAFYERNNVALDHEPRVLVIDVSQAMWIEDEIEGRVCLGKTYAEYLQEQVNPTRKPRVGYYT